MTDVLVTVLAALIGLAAGWLFSGRIEAESEAPVRPVWPALATGALSAAAAWHAGATWSAPVYVYFAVVSIPLAVVDLRTHRLPNAWTLTAYPLVAVGLLLPSALAGSWSDLGRAVAGGGMHSLGLRTDGGIMAFGSNFLDSTSRLILSSNVSSSSRTVMPSFAWH